MAWQSYTAFHDPVSCRPVESMHAIQQKSSAKGMSTGRYFIGNISEFVAEGERVEGPGECPKHTGVHTRGRALTTSNPPRQRSRLLRRPRQSHDIGRKDLGRPKLTRHLSMHPDIIEQAYAEVKKATSIRTIFSAMVTSHRATFSQTHKLLRQYLTISIISATSERAFSSSRLLTHLRCSMTKEKLNNCLLLHVHKHVVDSMDLGAIAADFALSR
ncbi:hypothetical protein Bbelb_051120 [Branchiostoma belcheri]|nr:hypothetical protein Bbelb_051120 [Branchiostoma belcheri]